MYSLFKFVTLSVAWDISPRDFVKSWQKSNQSHHDTQLNKYPTKGRWRL